MHPLQRIIAAADALPDKGDWINRFTVDSSDGNRQYVIAQHREKRHWGCACQAWRMRRHCKHLDQLGLPGHEKPCEPQIQRATFNTDGPITRAIREAYTEHTKPFNPPPTETAAQRRARHAALKPQPQPEPVAPPALEKKKRFYDL